MNLMKVLEDAIAYSDKMAECMAAEGKSPSLWQAEAEKQRALRDAVIALVKDSRPVCDSLLACIGPHNAFDAKAVMVRRMHESLRNFSEID